MTTLVGSQQRFRGSEATCQRTTSPYFLIRKNFTLLCISLPSSVLFSKYWGFICLLDFGDDILDFLMG